MKLRVGTAVLGVSVVLLAPACGSSGGGNAGGGGSGTGGGNGATAASFVHQVCSSIVTGVGEIKSKEQSFSTKVQADQKKGLPAVKADTVQFLGDAQTSFEEIRSKIAQAGTPDVQNAAKGKAVLLSALSTVLTKLKLLQADVKSASTKNQQAFQQKLQTDVGSLQSVFSNLSAGLNGLSSKELDAAAKKDPSCKQLSNASGSPTG